MRRMSGCLVAGIVVTLVLAAPAAAEDKVLFSFDDPAQAAAWQACQLPETRKPEPEAKCAVADGKLKITYAGGLWPTVATKAIPEDFSPWGTFYAEVTAPHDTVVGFRIMQAESKTGFGYNESLSRWESTVFLKAGKNDVALSFKNPQRYRTKPYDPKNGKAVTLEFYAYAPAEGESILLDSIRVTDAADPNAQNCTTPNLRPRDGFKVLGADMTVSGVEELGKKLVDTWVKPEKDKTVEEREAEFKALYEQLKKTHPKAVMVTLRDGDRGCDAADPEKVYSGLESVYVNSHGPDGNLVGRATGQFDYGNLELFMRHRSQLMRVDLSVLPKGANILAARLLLVSNAKPAEKANMFAAEVCNRPWVDGQTNCYEYAKGKFWKNVAGECYDGDDPDFLPLFVAYGPAEGKTNVWDFTEAVKYWTDGKHPNHGFFMHGDANFYARTFTRKADKVSDRPALVVVYEPR